ncbi:hypothetical protein CVT25_005620 [Psilocybe cyanescens]|uniref:MPN domain-containing protein n=1 Tax=Psilocybe cyanescens TaxID=93625 RepID=A0A409X6B2_PSICY|nr:hypothetical protein CVT25_005620 [Psilocybe cyanescens]
MSKPSYVILPEAYYKLFFHAAKHPHQPVNGVFLGTQNGVEGAVIIQDTVPLLHHWTSLSPMMEIGLDLATQHAQTSGLKVVGYYQGCERVDDTSLAPVGEKVASRIRTGFEDAVAFVIDGQKIGTSEVALVPYHPLAATSTWRPVSGEPLPFTPGSKFQLSSADSPSEAARYVQDQNLHFAFGDFDDHLEDVTIDWLRNRTCLP